MKKTVLVALVMLAGCALVFAAGKKEQSGTSAGEVVINFYEHSDNEAIVDKLVAAFNANNPGIRVVKHIIPDGDYDEKIRVLASGSSRDLDVFWIRTPAHAQQYIKNNVLLDLTPLARETGLNLTPIQSSLGAVSDAGGKFYGLPTTGSCWMLFYNKTLFDAKGLPYPENITYDQYLALAKQLTSTEAGKKYWGGVVPPWTLNLGASSAGEYLTAAAPMAKTRRYAEILHQMYVDDKSHPGIAEMSQGTFDINGYFEAGNIYMMINGDWEFQLLNSSLNYGVAPMPILPGAPAGASVGQASIFAISRNSAHPKEAWKFIEWCTTSPEGTKIYASSQNVPSYATGEALAVYKEIVKVPGVDYRFSAKVGPEQGPESYYGEINEAFVQEMQLYLLGEKNIDRMLNDFYALRQEIIANNK
jgi:ABC-type glycerol-3-phosphate transport system substrate-binding protein